MTADEKLFPDIILFNYETSQVILIEIKINGRTGRDAVTEIYGYVNEICNQLPFTSNFDISVIIVSKIYINKESTSSTVIYKYFNIISGPH